MAAIKTPSVLASSLPPDCKELLTNLYIVSCLQKGDKLNTGDMSLCLSGSWVGSIYRMIYGEDRNTTLRCINDLVKETLQLVKRYEDSPFLKNIINSLSEARMGINSLIGTYRDDIELVGRLKVILTDVDLQLEKYRHLLNGREELDQTNNNDSPPNGTRRHTTFKREGRA